MVLNENAALCVTYCCYISGRETVAPCVSPTESHNELRMLQLGNFANFDF